MADFYRYRQNFSSGLGPWEYVDGIYSEEEFADQLHREYGWSDHYRGCDIEKIEIAPESWIIREIERLENRIKYDTQTLEEYRNLIIHYSDEDIS